MEFCKVDELEPNYIKIVNPSEGKIRIDPFDGSELCKYKATRFGELLRGKAANQRAQLVDNKSNSWQQTGEELILENIVKYAQVEAQIIIISQYNQHRTDYLSYAEEIVSFTQELENETVRYRHTGRELVYAVTDTRKCYNSNQAGHVARNCRKEGRPKENETKKRSKPNNGNKWAFAATSFDDLNDGDWILDTGIRCHLVRDVSMMTKIASCPTSEPIQHQLSCVYFPHQLTRNLVSYGRLEDHGCLLGQSNGHHYVLNNGSVVYYVLMKNHVMVVDRTMNAIDNCDLGDVVMSVVATVGSGQTVKRGTLMFFSSSFDHLNFQTIKRLANT
ncbi:unnamed protein product [Albugo candida]|uniref:CCHC-type domain-containing protein n=1 Tax=Albugo candida TaxID=65357 RepID=A0A024FWD3_9STRA|nr:unnamed protein product [Albugo candida]|eukprot:CCI11351.1 unnamed protein product [Albugo candida]